jgi:uncharacterized membrane protein
MKTPMQQYFRHVSVHSDEGIRVDKAITVQKPPAEVYAFWRDLENLPRFMRHVEAVQELDDMHSHWAVKTIAGKVVEWDAEIIEDRPGEMISWRSMPGADVDNAGSVWFTNVPGGDGTMIRVELKYVPPAGKAGELIAKLFGRDADSEIEEDLGRVKSILETGMFPEDGWRDQKAGTIRSAVKTSKDYVRDHAWIQIAFAVTGLCVLGFFIGRQLSSRKRGVVQRFASSINRLQKRI